jgi:nitrogen fixation/metabolism regulation signal transduction histidine kinase
VTLRSRLLAAFLVLALVPMAVISTVSLVQLSRAIARWYRPGVDRTLVSALEVTKISVTRLESGMRAEAEEWAEGWPDGPGSGRSRVEAQAALRASGLDFLQTYVRRGGRLVRMDQLLPPGVLLLDGPELATVLEADVTHPQLLHTADGLLVAAAPTRTGKVIATGIRLSPDFYAQIDSVSHGLTYYRQLGVTAELQRRTVLLLVAGMTIVLVALALLLSARLARQMSRPLTELSVALGRVAGGSLEARVTPGGAAELRSLGESFNVMTERLDEARRAVQQAEREAAWRDVARKLAHEFKNTLTPMRLSLQLLQAQLEQVPIDARVAMAKSLGAALREVDSLSRLAGQFSQYARLPEPNFEPVDALEVARATAALTLGAPPEVRFEGAGPTQFLADPVLLSRALSNLLLNAREAGGDSDPIEMLVRTDATYVTFEVLDRGSGIPEELKGRLFEPYVSTKRRGSGLGLSLIRDIARQHHGDVALDNRPGGGARAVLILPRDPATVAAAEPTDRPRSGDPA